MILWYLKNTGQSYPSELSQTSTGIAGNDIKFEESLVQDQTNGAQGSAIAVLDTGVDYTHPDIENNIWINQNEVTEQMKITLDSDVNGEVSSNEILTYFRNNNLDINNDGVINLQDALTDNSLLVNNVDEDFNGFADDIIGWDFGDNDRDPMDTDGHGTHVAGTIAAEKDNNLGTAGIAYNSKIMIGKIAGGPGNVILTNFTLLAYNYVGLKQVTAVNMSYGGTDTRPESEIINDPEYFGIEYLVQTNAVPIVSAGNNTMPSSFVSPARFNNVITVGASDSKGNGAEFSNFGAKIDVTAPGVDILSLKSKDSTIATQQPELVYNNDYMVLSGTSMAAPVITAITTLLKANKPNLTVEQVRQYLRNNTVENSQISYQFGYGKILAENLWNKDITPIEKINFNSFENFDTLKGNKELNVLSDIPASFDVEYAIVGENYTIGLNSRQEFVTWTDVASNVASPGMTILNTNFIPDDFIALVRIRSNSTSNEISIVKEFTVDNLTLDYSYEIFNGSEDIPIKGAVPDEGGLYNLLIDYSPLGQNIYNQATLCDQSPNNQICNDPEVIGYIPASGVPTNGFYEIKYRLSINNNSPEPEDFNKIIKVDRNIKSGFPYQIVPGGRDIEGPEYAMMPMAVEDINNDNKKDILFVDSGKVLNSAQRELLGMTSRRELTLNALDNTGTSLPGFPFRLNPETGISGDTLESTYSASKPVIIKKDGETKIYFTVSYESADHFGSERAVRMYGVNGQGELLPNFPVLLGADNIDNGPLDESENTTISASDLNKDGKIDLVTAFATGRVVVISEDGDLLPGWPKDFSPNLVQEVAFLAPMLPPKPAIADINKDTFPDIILSYDNKIHVLNYLGESISSQFPYTAPGNYISSSPTIADLDGDSSPEIIFSSEEYEEIFLQESVAESKINILKSDATLFSEPFELDDYSVRGSIVPVNSDEDQELELAFVSARLNKFEEIVTNSTLTDSKLSIIETETFTNPIDRLKWAKRLTADKSQNRSEASSDTPIIGDIDGDDQLDIITSNGIRVFAFNLQGDLKPNFPLNLFYYDKSLATSNFQQITDLENDGKTDIVVSYIGNESDMGNRGIFNNKYQNYHAGYIIAYDFENQLNFKSVENQYSSLYGNNYNTNSLISETELTASISNVEQNQNFEAEIATTLQTEINVQNRQIAKVEFFQNEVKLGESNSSPYSFEWTPTYNNNLSAQAVPPISTNLSITVTTTDGFVINSTPININITPFNNPPTISITSPNSNLEIEEDTEFTVTTNPSDTNGSISRVEFSIDGSTVFIDEQSPFEYRTKLKTGSYSLTATAVDDLGKRTTSLPINLRVKAKATVTPRNISTVRTGGLNIQSLLVAIILIISGYLSVKPFFNKYENLDNSNEEIVQ
jgi:subtilisin family serine protease